jgi:hypothetical protein
MTVGGTEYLEITDEENSKLWHGAENTVPFFLCGI